MERDLELNLILLWFICIKLKQCVWLGFYLFILLPWLPQVLAENCFAEVAVHGMFWKFIVPGKKWGLFHKILENFFKFWNSKEKELHGKWSGLFPIVKVQLSLLRAIRWETTSRLPTVLCMRTLCKLWKFCSSSYPATDGKVVRMARAGGWHGCVYSNKALRLKFHQCPSAVCYIHSYIITSYFPLQLYFRIAIIWMSVRIQCSSHDPDSK